MLLAIDIGNSSIKFGIFEAASLADKFLIPTKRDYTVDELLFDRLRYIEERFFRIDSFFEGRAGKSKDRCAQPFLFGRTQRGSRVEPRNDHSHRNIQRNHVANLDHRRRARNAVLGAGFDVEQHRLALEFLQSIL